MRELKRLVDPDALLNPGVILNDDKRCHLHDLKPLPSVSPIVDTCIECGFCERYCPSRDYTTTPRRRIALQRELVILRGGPLSSPLDAVEIAAEYGQQAVDACATDGLCALGCPVKIDTGKLMKELRGTQHSALAERGALWAADHFALAVGAAKCGLHAGHLGARILGVERLTRLSRWAHLRSGRRLPAWHAEMPAVAPPLPPPRQRAGSDREEIVFFPSCLTRGLGPLPGEDQPLSPTQAFMDVLREANIHARYPDDLANLCCGQPFSSKGYVAAARRMAARTTHALYLASEQGRLPVVLDTSPCAWRIRTYDELLTGGALEQWRRLRILDLVEFLHDTVLQRVLPTEVSVPAILHPTCSLTKMGLEGKLRALAEACAVRVIIPENSGCCGFAGDRGFLLPELTEHATRDEAAEVALYPPNARHYSTCRTCELGLTAATGRVYSSIVYLVHEAVCRRDDGVRLE
jgi:D-lactate dehydrogenase